MFPINVPNETTMKGHAVFHDLVVSPRSAGPCSMVPWSSSRCTAIADSQLRDAILTEEILHLDFLHHLHVPETTKTARTNRQLFVSGKNNSDSNWYKYISFCICPPPANDVFHSCVYFLFETPGVAVQRLPLFAMIRQNGSAECEVLRSRKSACSLTRTFW